MAGPFIAVKCIRFGIKVAGKPESVAEEPLIKLPQKRKKPKVSKEEQQILDILGNIDAFDGTSKGQKEIGNGNK
jgi:hypothetical protein